MTILVLKNVCVIVNDWEIRFNDDDILDNASVNMSDVAKDSYTVPSLEDSWDIVNDWDRVLIRVDSFEEDWEIVK